MTDSQHARRSLETAICRDLGQPPEVTAPVIARAALGPAEISRFVAINAGLVGRPALLEILAHSRRVLDAGLHATAPWRGPSRAAHFVGRRENTTWLQPAFADVANEGGSIFGDITPGDLERWNLAVGAPGEWRTRSMRVDGYRVRFSPEQATDMVDRLLARANDKNDSAPLAATRLHVGLLLTHPFRDGNGRTARLAAAAILLRDGTRNSLQTCVEQHHHLAPQRYAAMMGQLRRGEVGVERVVDDFLGAMAGRCALAAWVRHRHHTLLQLATRLDQSDPITAVRCFEIGDCTSPLSTHGGQPIEAWHRLRPHLHPTVARELRSQLARAIGDGQSR